MLAPPYVRCALEGSNVVRAFAGSRSGNHEGLKCGGAQSHQQLTDEACVPRGEVSKY